jgi:GNAT superfamily N-acetyltransferase
MSTLELRQATMADLPILVDLYKATQRWLVRKGSDQWQNSREEKVRENIECSVVRGECFVAIQHGEIVGTVTVDEYADPEFWHESDEPKAALYLHRMMVDRRAAGHDIGETLLRWAENLAMARGRKWLRLDAWKTNTALHDYYLQQGFEHVRTVALQHRGSGALFQREVA